jgi:uncharacterized protein YlxP (DUF503 family)
MYVGILQVQMALDGPTNRKEKRQIVRSLKDRLRHRFNVAVAEVGPLDPYREAVLGVTTVANDPTATRGRLEQVLRFLERARHASVEDFQLEVL